MSNAENEKAALLARLNQRRANTLLETLDITITDIGADYLVATMPVTARVHQPHGILHGGANVALGESAASTLSNCVIDTERYYAVGTNIQATHLRPMQHGMVTCTARLRRQGRTMHYCEMEVRDEQNRLICAMSMSNMVLART
ncbi:MAG: PaaI family thioesterase [Neisseria sp.]|nr:PaaI family thioesterase [Neisseria sp.]